ncbi:MAG: SAM-dependent chlorinase/fluorinase [Bacteroidales bacterium]|nr:SAM-dependent chlorinase/fluorinase [Bacteroidales bacterium]MBN2748612.1 SAM-dependent chlorinase/fluorinase [Bacteroidales bacterium]
MDEVKPIVLTLTTDWNQQDYYLGMLKGRVVSACPFVSIMDISHQIPSFNNSHAAFVVRNSYMHFPTGSIHLVMVNSESGPNDRLLYFKKNDHHFLIPDNGLIGLLFKDFSETVYAIDYTEVGSFASLSAVEIATTGLCSNRAPKEWAILATDYETHTQLRATIDEYVISGSVIYIDSYHNAITNISQELFDRVGRSRRFDILVQSNHNRVSTVSNTYRDVEPGDLLALFNSANLLEIAICNGYAAQLLNLNIGSSVRIKFYEA